MIGSLKPLIETQIGKIVGARPCGGGDINKSFQIETEKGQKFFLKSNASHLRDMFDAESIGLSVLKNRTSFRTPKVIDVFQSTTESGLLLEWVEPSEPDDLSWEKFW